MLGRLSVNAVRLVRTTTGAKPQFVLVEKDVAKGVTLLRLNRPEVHNAISIPLIRELRDRLSELDADSSVRAIVLTGNERIFSAGADIKGMASEPASAHHLRGDTLYNLEDSECIANTKKPIIAAVHGFAFGGGCEIAMQCDVIYASNKARFAQPEINIGTIPGWGGTQRLVRAVGKSLAMEMILTGNRISAEEAKAAGLVSKVFPVDQVLPEAIKLAEKIAEQSALIVAMAKESVNASYEMSLQSSIRYERQIFNSTFATKDREEGMKAFTEKRNPNWTDN